MRKMKSNDANCAMLTIFNDGFQNVGMVVAKNSHYKRIFSKFISKAKSSGIWDQLEKSYKIKNDCPRDNFAALGMSKLGILFLSYLVTVVIATIILMIEFIILKSKIGLIE